MEAELDSDRVQVPTSRGLVTGSSPMIFVNKLKSVDFYKSPQELTEMALKYHDEDALPNFVGLNIINDFRPFCAYQRLMNALSRTSFKLSEKLADVQSFCIHAMIVRAFKNILRKFHWTRIRRWRRQGNFRFTLGEEAFNE